MPTTTSTSSSTTSTSTTMTCTSFTGGNDYLFGEQIPQYIPVSVFPYDPDFSFKRGHKWDNVVHSLSPILEQRFVLSDSPLITFEVGFNVMKGEIFDVTSKPGQIWQFFLAHLGRAVGFWYYDVVPWSYYPGPWASTGGVDYRDDPAARLTHPGGLSGAEAGYSSSTGRYIAHFDEDDMSIELFVYKIRKAQLKISGYPG